MSKQTERYKKFFADRGMTVDVNFYHGKYFSVAQAHVQDKNNCDLAFVSEGVARRSDDRPDDKRAAEISEGRALKALFLKVSHQEIVGSLLSDQVTEGISEVERKKYSDALAMAQREYANLVHGRIHLLMA